MIDFFLKGPINISIFLVIIFLFLIFQYKKLLSNKIIKTGLLLLILRIVVILILFYLVINPVFIINNANIQNSKIGVFIDNSKSIRIHDKLDSLNYINKIQFFIEELRKNKNKIEIYKFADSVDRITNLDQIKFDSKNTSFDFLENKSIVNKFDELILLTDGISTYGKKIEEIQPYLPINSLGIGDSNLIDDVKIEKLEYNNKIGYGDSLIIKYNIKSSLSKDFSSKVSLKNIENKIIYSTVVNLKSGVTNFNNVLKINSKDLSYVNSLFIEPLELEYNKKNNYKDFKIDIIDKPKNILLVSGSISTNSYLIKDKIQSLKNVSFDHLYKINTRKWNKNIDLFVFDNYDLIIFDDFININQISIGNDQMILYFEGPNSDSNHSKNLDEIFDMKIENDPLNNSYTLYSNLGQYDNVKYSLFPRLKKKYSYFSNENKSSLVKYSDGSDAIIMKNNYIGVFIPELGDAFRRTIDIKIKDVLDIFFDNLFQLSFAKDNILVKFENIKNDYYLGEEIKIYLEYSPIVDPLNLNKNIVIELKQADFNEYLNVKYDIKNDKYFVSFVAESSGLWNMFGQFSYNNQKIKMNPKNILIQDFDKEGDQIYQNIFGLKSISNASNGKYVDIKTYNDNFVFENIVKNEKNEYNTISNFKYVWIIIIFFSIEWYFRKKKGLL